MRFVKHSGLDGKHSFFSPSKPAWLRYTDDKIERMFSEHMQAVRGTEEHAFAAQAIKLGHRLPDEQKTLNMYVNDCIGWRMKPEVVLYWSDWAFGTADAIGYTERDKTLRISDLKTGKSRTTFDQLLVYAALFCLEYDHPRPFDMNFELRIYQSNKIKLEEPDPHDVFLAKDRILTGTRIIEEIIEEQYR